METGKILAVLFIFREVDFQYTAQATFGFLSNLSTGMAIWLKEQKNSEPVASLP